MQEKGKKSCGKDSFDELLEWLWKMTDDEEEEGEERSAKGDKEKRVMPALAAAPTPALSMPNTTLKANFGCDFNTSTESSASTSMASYSITTEDDSPLKYTEDYLPQANPLSSSNTSVKANFINSFNNSTSTCTSACTSLSFDTLVESITAPKQRRRRRKGKAPKNPAKVTKYTKAGLERRYRINDTFQDQKELLSALIEECRAKASKLSGSISLHSLPPTEPRPPYISALFERYSAGKTKNAKRKDEEYTKTLKNQLVSSRSSSKVVLNLVTTK
jgi:hypothetical protein